MSVTKHKIFKVEVNPNGKFSFSKTVENAINTFLAESNNVYVNHSVTTLTEDVDEYGNIKTICKYIVISIVYKDLNSSSLNLKGTSKKIKETIHKEIESGNSIQEPNILTDLDKEVMEFELYSREKDALIVNPTSFDQNKI